MLLVYIVLLYPSYGGIYNYYDTTSLMWKIPSTLLSMYLGEAFNALIIWLRFCLNDYKAIDILVLGDRA